MSDKPDKKPDAKADAGHGDAKVAKKAGGGILSKMPVLLGGVMVVEAVVLFAGFKYLGMGGPTAATGATLHAEDGVHEEGADAEHAEDANADTAAAGDHAAETSDAKAADHGDGKDTKPVRKKKFAELEVVSARFPNKMSGKTFLYDVNIVLVTKGANEVKVKEKLEDRKALITDRIRTIIAQTDPEKLGGGSEPGLETLRRQVKYQLDQIVGEGTIDEVLVPRCIPFRTDF